MAVLCTAPTSHSRSQLNLLSSFGHDGRKWPCRLHFPTAQHLPVPLYSLWLLLGTLSYAFCTHPPFPKPFLLIPSPSLVLSTLFFSYPGACIFGAMRPSPLLSFPTFQFLLRSPLSSPLGGIQTYTPLRCMAWPENINPKSETQLDVLTATGSLDNTAYGGAGEWLRPPSEGPIRLISHFVHPPVSQGLPSRVQPERNK